MLAQTSWSLVEQAYGPHIFDPCALDSNAQRDEVGGVLPYFTPWPTLESAGMNVVAQHIPTDRNLYVFPPIVLTGLLLRFLLDSAHIIVTIVVFDLYPPTLLVAESSVSIDQLIAVGKKRESFGSLISLPRRLYSLTPVIRLVGVSVRMVSQPVVRVDSGGGIVYLVCFIFSVRWAGRGSHPPIILRVVMQTIMTQIFDRFVVHAKPTSIPRSAGLNQPSCH